MAKKIYVIQKHNASHLHYDLRLEKGGVLKSWAIPKEPSLSEKRLAVQVDDHDISYAKFEGVISEGNYGAGKVEIWDSGTFEEEKWTSSKIIIDISGKKLKGKFCLLKFEKAGDKEWLFFKVKKQEKNQGKK